MEVPEYSTWILDKSKNLKFSVISLKIHPKVAIKENHHSIKFII